MSSNPPIRLGRIGYLNVLPLHYPLEQGILHGDFELIAGPPRAQQPHGCG